MQATINLIITNLSAIVANFSTYQATFDRFLIGLGESLGVVNITDQLQEQLNKLDLQGFLAGTLSSLSTTVGTIVIVVIYIIFLLLEEVAFSKKSMPSSPTGKSASASRKCSMKFMSPPTSTSP